MRRVLHRLCPPGTSPKVQPQGRNAGADLRTSPPCAEDQEQQKEASKGANSNCVVIGGGFDLAAWYLEDNTCCECFLKERRGGR